MSNKASVEEASGPSPARSSSTGGSEISAATAIAVVAGVLLAVAVAGIYGQALQAPFVYDDLQTVLANRSIRTLWPLAGAAGTAPLSPPDSSPTAGRPLVNLTLAFNYAIGGTNPLGYRIVNIGLHVASALLLWGLVWGSLRLEFFEGKFDRAAAPLAFLAALVWALHPLQTEAIEYVTQRTELMVGFFYLGTLYCSLRYFTASPPTRGRWCAGAIAACCLGMACKEVMVTAPVMVLLFERTFVAGTFRAALRRSWRLYLGLAASWFVLLVLNYGGPRSTSAGFGLEIPLLSYWATQAKILWMYLQLSVWPWPLVISYEIPLVDSAAVAWPWLLATSALAATTLVLLWCRTSAGFLAAWVILILSPTLVVPILLEIAAERRMYLPLAAITAFAVGGSYLALRGLASRWAASRGQEQAFARWPLAIVGAAAIAVAGVWALVSVRRLDAYESSLTLWKDAEQYQPENLAVLGNLSHSLVNAGRPREAIPYLRRALQKHPESVKALRFMGVALRNMGQPNEAIEYLQRAAELAPNDPETFGHWGHALLNAGRPKEAVEQLRRALELQPNYSLAYEPLARALLAVGKPQEAVVYFDKAIELRPDAPGILMNYATALMAAGRLHEAVAIFKRLEREQPESLALRQNYGNALFHLRQYDDAARQFELALRDEPNSSLLHQNFGGCLLKLGRSQQAAEHLSRAIEIGPQTAHLYATLGVALFNLNQFDAAVAEFERALQLNPEFAMAKSGLQQVANAKALLGQ